MSEKVSPSFLFFLALEEDGTQMGGGIIHVQYISPAAPGEIKPLKEFQ